MENLPKPWYVEWFNTPYYHILYRNHDNLEAQQFILGLMQFLPISEKTRVLEVACGKGMNARFLNKQNISVTGIDMAENSIKSAQTLQNETLRFVVHDMRDVFLAESFDVVLNLFDGFGHFEENSDNQQAITATAQNLVKGGKFVLDFFNTRYAIRKLIPRYTQQIQGIEFQIREKFTQGYIYKDIRFEDNEEQFRFQEKVKAITQQDFAVYFRNAGLKIISILGDYQLNQFNLEESPRMIFVTEKI
jgi:SAM-dependent methyltransferase